MVEARTSSFVGLASGREHRRRATSFISPLTGKVALTAKIKGATLAPVVLKMSKSGESDNFGPPPFDSIEETTPEKKKGAVDENSNRGYADILSTKGAVADDSDNDTEQASGNSEKDEARVPLKNEFKEEKEKVSGSSSIATNDLAEEMDAETGSNSISSKKPADVSTEDSATESEIAKLGETSNKDEKLRVTTNASTAEKGVDISSNEEPPGGTTEGLSAEIGGKNLGETTNKNETKQNDTNASTIEKGSKTVDKDETLSVHTIDSAAEKDSEVRVGSSGAREPSMVPEKDSAGESAIGKEVEMSNESPKERSSAVGLTSKPGIEEEVKESIESTKKSLPSVAAKDLAEKDDSRKGENRFVPLTVASVLSVFAGVYVHKDAWASFFSSLNEMNANSTPGEFAAALKFWLFAAVIHPILQPIFWISEVLHGTPGPKLAGLVPYTFLGEAALVVIVLSVFEEIRRALAIALFAGFVTYLGAGLDGNSPLITGLKADYDIQLDDSYKGRVVKGCPAYDTFRQPSVDNFSLDKYQGRWYWQKVHDWTQFKEVYDTTLDIKLTPDGKGYVNNLGIKGPSPKSNPLSWSKSPLANGAHYFWSGKIDENDPPGLSHEKGFGVEFPNYIVDVKTDPESGEYEELIQFQCIEVGGVRLYEGIDFMSRSPGMSNAELKAMHARAEKAGLNPYGASPEQMIRIDRADGAFVDNEWQDLWKKVGVDKLLDKLAKTLEKETSK